MKTGIQQNKIPPMLVHMRLCRATEGYKRIHDWVVGVAFAPLNAHCGGKQEIMVEGLAGIAIDKALKINVIAQ